MEFRKYGHSQVLLKSALLKYKKARCTDRKEVENSFKRQEEKMSCPFLAESVESFDVSLLGTDKF